MTTLPQFVKIAPDGVPEYFLDHTLLSTFRMCESRFVLDYVQNYRPKGNLPWSLNFGTLIHSCIEEAYTRQMHEKFELNDWLTYCTDLWRTGNYESYAHTSQYKALGGFQGFVTTCARYAAHYIVNKSDNLKCVALEIPFGKAKEVPLLESHQIFSWAPFRLYLSGKMDYIFDDGKRLGPLDHKTFSTQGKNPIVTYEVQEGMTGYVYAMTHIYKTLKREFENSSGLEYTRKTDVVWMNFILTASEPDANKKFMRVPLYKTPFQLEEWRLRQISSTAKLHQILFEGRMPDFNASVCTNYWHSTCHYQAVHRLPSAADQLIILKNNFTQDGPEWNPEKTTDIKTGV